MKLTSIFLVIVIFVLFSCSPTDSGTKQTGLVGEWSWIESTHGWTGQTVFPNSVGYSQQLIFRSDNTFSHFRADTLIISGIYSLETNENQTIVNYQVENEESYPNQQLEFINEDVIKLIYFCSDCPTNTYDRIK